MSAARAQRMVIVGAGQAGAQAALSLRQSGFRGEVLLIGDECRLPYQRPPLSKKFLAGLVPEAGLSIRPASFYETRGIELLTSSRVTHIECRARRVHLEGGDRVGYDKLLIATGGRARSLEVPGDGLRGIHTVRTLDDVIRLRAEITPGAGIVIVGAGYIGLETAAALRTLGCDVTVLEAERRVLARVAAPAVSRFFAARHAAEGVRLRTATRVTRFVGERRVRAVETAAGEVFEAEAVIVGIGLVPNTELAAAAGLHCDGGLRVDAACRTSDPHVFGAGDVTLQDDPCGGRPCRIESVENAIWQAKTAARGMLGSPAPARDVPWFWSEQYDLKLQIAGLSHPDDRIVVRGDPADGAFSTFHMRDGRITAVEAVGRHADFIVGKALVGDARPVSAEALADVSRPLRELADAAHAH